MKQALIYDFIFIGMGARNCLILKSSIEHGQLKNKEIAIIESENKATNGKTHGCCATPNEYIVKELSPLISHQYQAIEMNQRPKQNIQEQPYFYFKSIDRYHYTAELISKFKSPIYRQEVKQLKYHNGIITIIPNESDMSSLYVFDSRPFSFRDLKNHDIFLNQSFYGLHLTCEKTAFNQEKFKMMNFHVDQNEFNQFTYILPYSSNEALLELTRCGSIRIDSAYVKSILRKKTMSDFGPFIIENKIACIPMISSLNQASEYNNALHTGIQANLTKRSTAYHTFEFSKVITKQSEHENLDDSNRLAIPTKKRFRFYDYLLLHILNKWPKLGKKIFSSLFKEQEIRSILNFLDGPRSLFQYIKIFIKLPIKPFFKAACMYLKTKIPRRYIVAMIVVLFYSFLNLLSKDFANYFAFLSIGLGLILIGIPHGAVDYILPYKGQPQFLWLFILNYACAIILFYFVWQYFPKISLVFFIVFSSFHFGEAEYMYEGKAMKSVVEKIKVFFLGLSILLFIICSHFEESLKIISKLIPLSAYDGSLIKPYCIVFELISLLIILQQYLIDKKLKNNGLILILLLGLFTPLILAFSLYFVIQHSYNAWQYLKSSLSVNSNYLHAKSLPYTIGALAFFIVMVLNRSELNHVTENLWVHFFIFLACISFPHFLIMHFFYTFKSKANK